LSLPCSLPCRFFLSEYTFAFSDIIWSIIFRVHNLSYSSKFCVLLLSLPVCIHAQVCGPPDWKRFWSFCNLQVPPSKMFFHHQIHRQNLHHWLMHSMSHHLNCSCYQDSVMNQCQSQC
jgi:hypothetical protein